MKERDFICMLIHIHGNQTLIEKYWDEGGQKWVWQIWSHDSKIDSISIKN